MERVYSRVRHLGRKGEPEKCARRNRRVREGISVRYGRYGKARTRGNDVQTGKIARKIYGKETIWVVRQAI